MSLLRPLARLWAGVLGCTVLALALALAARLVIPLGPWAPAPALLDASPPDGAAAVPPRTPITLRFSAPMNRAAAAAALRIDPPTPGSPAWSDDATTLTFRPAAPLRPDLTYTVSLDSAALGRWWRPLAEPAAVSFRTAPQPAVVAAMPQGPGAPADASLAVIFSQPMVPPEAVGRQAAPPIQVTPPISATARWLDQRTLLVRPAAPLPPATRYSASISAGLTDLRGVELGAPFSWSFTTAWPAIIERSPAEGARWVSPRAPLTLRLDAPLDPGLLRQTLQVTPPVDGELASAVVGGTQVITFTPRGGWAFDTTYTVRLVEPPGSGLGPPPAAPWRFEVEPQPRLLAFFPGQGQLLAPGQPVRLVFSTPMDGDTLAAGLSIEPPVDGIPLSVAETEVRLTPELRPSTLYTITVAAGTADRSGEPLAAPVQVRVRTAAARPALAAPGAFGGVLTLPVSRTAAVDLQATNLSALDLSLYRLDQPTLLLALDLGPQGLAQLRPERYGQPLVRGWRVGRSDPLDQPATLTLPVGPADGDPLDPGAYYLRALSPEGPRADLLLLVTSARLTLLQGPGTALVWATDRATGAPLPGLPVALYRDGAPVAAGVTAADGTWSQPVADAPGGPLLALAGAGGPAVVRGDWRPPAPPAPAAYRVLAFGADETLAPGAAARITGFARRALPDGTADLADDAPCRLLLRNAADIAVAPAAPCTVEPGSGALRGEIAIPARLSPGSYTVAVQVGDGSAAVPLRVEPPSELRPLDLAAQAGPDSIGAGVSAAGLPLAGAVVSWSLSLEPLAAPPLPAGFALTLPAAEPAARSGKAIAGEGGAFSLGPLPGGPAALGRRFLLQVEVPGSPPLRAERQGLVPPGPALAAVRLPSRLVPSDRRSTVELLALDGLGRPRPGASLDVRVFPTGGADDRPLLIREATAGADGLAAVQLVQLNPGSYEVVASADGGPPTVASLWVYGGRFTGWDVADGRLAVVPDRDRYRPGDVASLLVAVPEPQASLLLTVERGGTLGSQVRQLRAGQVITLPITADMAPVVSIGAVAAAGPELRAGSATIAVEGGEAPPAVSLAADRADYLPAATATLTVTASDGAPIATSLLLTLAPELGEGAPSGPVPLLAPPPPPPLTVAALPPPAAAGQPAPAPAAMPAHGVAAPFEGGPRTPGVAVARVALPEAPGRWRLTAYVPDGPGAVVAASTVVTVSRPLELALLSPPALAPGDRGGVTLTLRNTSPVTQAVRLSLAAGGLDLTAPAERSVTLPPGGAERVAWEVAARPGAAPGSLRLRVRAPGVTETLSRDLPVIAPQPPAAGGATLVGSGPLAGSVDLPPGASELRVALAPGLRAALADQAAALAALQAPATDDRAALALIAAGLARAGDEAERQPWAERARAAAAALDAGQNADGGWGWWPDTPSDPFVTAFVVEAQAAARAALGEPRPANLRALAYLGRVAPAAGPDLAAFIAYAAARAGGRDGPPAGLIPAARADAELSADGLAFLALALPPGQSGPALDRLGALAVRERPEPAAPSLVRWSAEGPAGLPRSPTAVTAAAAQALAARRPDDGALPGAEQALLTAWGVDGWATSYEAARVAAALLGRVAPAAGGPRALLLAGEQVLAGGPFTTTVRAAVPAAPLGPRPTLSVQASGPATYLVASSAGGPAPDTAGLLAVAQDLVDPASGADLDPRAIRLGQVVALRVTAVVPRPLLRADLVVPLPGGLEPLAVAPRPPFLHGAGPGGRHELSIGAAGIGPGVYTQTILARAVAPGSFAAPPARLAATFEPGLTAVASAPIAVQIDE